ncbi:MAG: hypothetical protein KDK64_02245 [Chlamydiia bacterium]|nr:hypothetical protein [Chlamydiia bacterium]
MEDLLMWNQASQGDGVIVGTDETQEWMLKWWWEHYSKHNDYPVTFFDLGMSKSAHTWCASKGTVHSFSFPKGWIAPKEKISLKDKAYWEEKYPGDLWEGRTAWFAKPFLLLKSPYKRTIWMDLDCEVRRSITPLFEYADPGEGFSILKFALDELDIYNTGVIVCRQGSSIPEKWAAYTQKHNHRHFGDETVLMEMIEQEGLKITPHPLIFNWPTIIPQDPNTVIRHHAGGYGKTRILGAL